MSPSLSPWELTSAEAAAWLTGAWRTPTPVLRVEGELEDLDKDKIVATGILDVGEENSKDSGEQDSMVS